MKSGLFFTADPSSPVSQELSQTFDIDVVQSLDHLKKALHKKEYEFLYIDVKDTSDMLSLIHLAFKLDEELVIMTHHEYHFPKVDHFYLLSGKNLQRSVIEVLSFHQAKKDDGLQASYGSFDERGHDHFYLSEHSPLGIVLTDSEDSIFYVNETAKNLLNFDDANRLLKYYVNLVGTNDLLNQTDAYADSRFFEFLPIIDSDLYVSVLQKDVLIENERFGSIIYIEDVTDRQQASEKLNLEKTKYQKLTNRLNDIILKGLGADTYNLSYIRRKLDLEIKHVHRLQSESKVVFLGLPQFEKKVLANEDRKEVLAAATKTVTEKFSKLHIVGQLGNGKWLVILQEGIVDAADEMETFGQQMQGQLQDQFPKFNLKVKTQLFEDLSLFQKADELLLQVGINPD